MPFIVALLFVCHSVVDAKIISIDNPQKLAEAVDLVYVTDKDPGIKRLRQGKGFRYIYNNRRPSADDLLRIKKLVIPPAWTSVWICAKHNGHIQCTGLDALGRKQYRYHADWIHARSQTKYYRLLQFGETLPLIREQVEKDLASPGLTERKVLAAVVSIMEQTAIRIGSSSYEKLYGSFGLTTLKDKHVKIEGSKLEFCFKGKKGVEHTISLKNKKLARIVRQCRDIPGRELFQYKDENGNYRSIDSGKVNEYIKSCCTGNFTAKDFRTWAGSVHALNALYVCGPAENITQLKKKTTEAIDYVSRQLGNTKMVCRKYYIHPSVLTAYENNVIQDLFAGSKDAEEKLSIEETILMKLLRSEFRKAKKPA